jgi:hypothetical protein
MKSRERFLLELSSLLAFVESDRGECLVGGTAGEVARHARLRVSASARGLNGEASQSRREDRPSDPRWQAPMSSSLGARTVPKCSRAFKSATPLRNLQASRCFAPVSTEHEGTTLYHLSSPLVLAVLQSKITMLTDPALGMFGPLERSSLGRKKAEQKKNENIETQGMKDENGEMEEETPDACVVEDKPVAAAATAKVFPTVSQGLGREGVGDGQGMSAEIQIGTFFYPISPPRP